MGLSLDTSLQIAGYRASVLRDGLQGYMRTHSRANMLDLKSVFPLRKDGAIMLEECLDRGLFDRETSAITPAGETIARAKVTPRAPLAKAKAVLENLLKRVEDIEQNPDAVSQVDEIWLFGSLLRDEGTVGDIDLAMSTVRRENFRTNHDERYKHVEAMLNRYGKVLATREEPWVQEERLMRFELFGDRRHPLLAGVQTGFDGRNAALIISANLHWGTSLVLNRHIDLAASRWTLHVCFDDVEFHRFRRRANPAPVAGVAAVLALRPNHRRPGCVAQIEMTVPSPARSVTWCRR